MFQRIQWPMSPAPTKVPEIDHLRDQFRILGQVSLTGSSPNCSSAAWDPRSMKRSGNTGSKGLRPRCSFTQTGQTERRHAVGDHVRNIGPNMPKPLLRCEGAKQPAL
jgi:hypothetical protein